MEHEQTIILVIDDDKLTTRIIDDKLTEAGYAVHVAHDGQQGLRQMLTAQDRPQDVIRGLDEGADEYVTKPFELDVLLARVRAVLRRAALQPAVSQKEEVAYSDGYLTFNPAGRRVTVDGNLVKLTPTEYNLLSLLIKNAGRVLPYRELLEQVWGWEYIDDVDYLRVYIWHLRRKVEPDSKNPRYVLTEHGVGYRFEGAGS
jgi:two-component system KDP operon response regulator KdpE